MTSTYTNNNSESNSISTTIANRLKAMNKRFFANDNISEYIREGEMDMLIEELSGKFTSVLDSLVIDHENDPNSHDTGKRLAKMYLLELMEGRYTPAPKATAFPNEGPGTYKGMIVIRAEIKSVCSHHHQPVSGVAYIGVIPTSKVIGLSKYIRIAQHCARRGTLQEDLCNDIANKIMEATDSENVAVHIAATHGCCENRGVMATSSLTQTTVLHGMFYMNSTKEEFFDNIKLQQKV